MMIPYVVRTGDYLRKLAARFGFDAATVWNDPKNADLRAQRRNMDVLMSGDLLYIPATVEKTVTITKETSQTYQAAVPLVHVRQRLVLNGEPLVGESFRLEGLPEPKEGASDGDGWISLEVPTHAHRLTLVLPKRGVTLDLRVGGLDPENTNGGVAMRLRHLGFLSNGEGTGEPAREALRASIAAFQTHYALPSTGTADLATQDMLIKVHGS